MWSSALQLRGSLSSGTMETPHTATLSLKTHTVWRQWRLALSLSLSPSLYDPDISLLQECQNDTHPAVPELRKQRIRVYRTTRLVQLDGCQTSFIYRLEAYLIIDNVTEEDSGEYIFNTTVTHAGFAPITATRNVNVSISMSHSPLLLSLSYSLSLSLSLTLSLSLSLSLSTDCQHFPERANCSALSLSVGRGNSSHWDCVLTDHPAANLLLLQNKTTVIHPSKPGTTCGKSSQVIFYMEETKKHTCYSYFKVFVLLCSANTTMVGEYSITNSSGGHAPGSRVVVNLVQDPHIIGITPSSSVSLLICEP